MVWVASEQTIQTAVRQSKQVDTQIAHLATALAIETQRITFERAYKTGDLAMSWHVVRTGPSSRRVVSRDRKARWAEGGTGKPERTAKYGVTRVIRPKRATVLRFPVPKSVTNPDGVVYAKWVRGWKPQHLLRDAGRRVGRRGSMQWRESAHPINRATARKDY